MARTWLKPGLAEPRQDIKRRDNLVLLSLHNAESSSIMKHQLWLQWCHYAGTASLIKFERSRAARLDHEGIVGDEWNGHQLRDLLIVCAESTPR